jgi:bifunctional non-homologous end joining protein LigD
VARKNDELVVSGRRIAVSNLDKVLYPGGHFTKAEVIDYYIRIAPILLPYLKQRPVTLKRFPDGIYGEFFYEKDAPAFTPDWVATFPVPRRERNGPDIRYILINDLPTLVWLANLNNLEIHPFLHHAPHIDRPDWLVFDLDPGEGANILTCARIALILRAVLIDLNLQSFVKVSGSKGLQVYVPLNTETTYQQTRTCAKAIAELLAGQYPKLIVAVMAKALRRRKVFIDWSQNDDYKTTVGVYSLRAKYHRPYVSIPVEWGELERALARGDEKSLFFTPQAVLERVNDRGDLFRTVLKLKQQPPLAGSSVAPGGNVAGRKINVDGTPGTAVRRSRQGGRRRFVIDKNRSGGNYTLRLEMDGVLKSWSIPGLPAGNTKSAAAKRLSDQLIQEKRFAGRNSKRSNHTWDEGTYDLIEGNYERGFLRVYLEGEKSIGEWILERREPVNRWRIRRNETS